MEGKSIPAIIEDDDAAELIKRIDTGWDADTTQRKAILPQAALKGKVEIVKALLAKGMDPNYIDRLGNSILSIAARKGHVEVIKALLSDPRVDPNLQNPNTKDTPVLVAIENKKLEAAAALLEKADPNIPNVDTGHTPLYYACFLDDTGNIDFVKLLLDKGADPNKKSGNSQIGLFLPLNGAIGTGNIEIVNALLEKGADVNLTLPNESSSLQIAIRMQSYPLFEKILALTNDEVLNKVDSRSGATPLHAAIFIKNPKMVKAILEKGADPNKYGDVYDTPLIIACDIKPETNEEIPIKAEIIEALLEKNADVNLENPKTHVFPLFSLMLRATKRLEPMTIELIDKFVEKGADINKKVPDLGVTILFRATRVGLVNLVKKLLEKGADKTVVNKEGQTAYDVADKYGLEELKALLLVPTAPPIPYKGKEKSDIDKYLVYLGKVDETTTEEQAKSAVKNNTFCPVCHDDTERSAGCLYMHHACNKDRRHRKLFDKYKNPEGEIWWCVDCGRICSGHKHYALGLADGSKPELLPDGSFFAISCDNSDPRDINGYVNPATGIFIPPAKTNGGGGTTEKLKRVARMIDYAFELQHFVGDISEQEAREELIEETWNGALMRMRFDPLKFKRWKTDLTAFKTESAGPSAPAPEAIPEPGDIQDPVVVIGSDPISLDDDIPVIQFKHKNKDGVMFDHVHPDGTNYFLGKTSLIEFMTTMGEKLGKCFDDECGGWLWPQEIEKAFADPRLEVTDADRAILAKYKERFNSAKSPIAGGGSKWKFNFINDMENGQCYLPKKKAGNRTRKTNKRAKKTRRA